MKLNAALVFVFFLTLLSLRSVAQFNLNGQLIERFEYRNGYGKLLEDDIKPTSFISQRLRLQAGYTTRRLKLYASIQDVRTWGSTSQIKISDGYLSLHEGWGEINIDTSWSVKVGRQELSYDNHRFLGNLDWALQARSHDFALVKYEKNKNKLHIGAGYNQNAESLSSGTYSVPNQYKAAQMLWFNHLENKFEVSFLFWNNGLESVKKDSVGKVTSQKILYSQTIGLPTIKYQVAKNNTLSGFVYYQMGMDGNNKVLNAYDISIQTSQVFPLKGERKPEIRATLGAEFLSGTNNNNTENTNNSFNPMYSTGHMHNGYQDYFYVGGRHVNNVGLNDIFLRLKYKHSKMWFISANIHEFISNAKVYDASKEVLSGTLGTEIDITGGIEIHKDASLQIGYSQIFATSTLEYIQKVSNPAATQNWLYIMLVIRPNSTKKFIGLLF